MATGGCDNPSDKIASFRFCSNCAKSNKIREAFKYCMECNGYYCQACVDRHKRLSGLKGHHLMDMSTLKSTCSMYCGKHNVVGCKSCMTSEHRYKFYFSVVCQLQSPFPSGSNNLYQLHEHQCFLPVK